MSVFHGLLISHSDLDGDDDDDDAVQAVLNINSKYNSKPVVLSTVHPGKCIGLCVTLHQAEPIGVSVRARSGQSPVSA